MEHPITKVAILRRTNNTVVNLVGKVIGRGKTEYVALKGYRGPKRRILLMDNTGQITLTLYTLINLYLDDNIFVSDVRLSKDNNNTFDKSIHGILTKTGTVYVLPFRPQYLMGKSPELNPDSLSITHIQDYKRDYFWFKGFVLAMNTIKDRNIINSDNSKKVVPSLDLRIGFQNYGLEMYIHGTLALEIYQLVKISDMLEISNCRLNQKDDTIILQNSEYSLFQYETNTKATSLSQQFQKYQLPNIPSDLRTLMNTRLAVGIVTGFISKLSQKDPNDLYSLAAFADGTRTVYIRINKECMQRFDIITQPITKVKISGVYYSRKENIRIAPESLDIQIQKELHFKQSPFINASEMSKQQVLFSLYGQFLSLTRISPTCLKAIFNGTRPIKLYSFDKENDEKLHALLPYHNYHVIFVKKLQKEEYAVVLTPFTAFL